MKLSIALVFLICLGSIGAKQNDCAYTKLDNSTNKDTACSGTDYALVRSVACENGETVDICCTKPYRQDIQDSRQNWFYAITSAIKLFSTSSCTKRILCDQGCLDGIEEGATIQSSYPEVLDGFSEEQAEYVDAFLEGERLSCFGENPYSYNKEDCRADCSEKYTQCEDEMNDSFRIRLFYMFTRVGHRIGMNTFTLYWCVRDILALNQSESSDASELIKEAYSSLANRMKQLEDSFTSSLLSQNWNLFLPLYSGQDPELVQFVAQHQTFEQFQKMQTQIQEILNSNDNAL